MRLIYKKEVNRAEEQIFRLIFHGYAKLVLIKLLFPLLCDGLAFGCFPGVRLGWKGPSLLNRQELWALMIVTESLLRS